ncbi:MAG: response regulator [Xanthobacteraceae bacterium]
MKILLIEDDGLLAYMVESTLEAHGYTVLGPARSVQSATDLAAQYRPDLAVVDIDLGGKESGVDVARRLNALFNTPSIYLTGQERVARANSDCAIGLILKPVSPDDLVQAIDCITRRNGETVPPALTLFRT